MDILKDTTDYLSLALRINISHIEPLCNPPLANIIVQRFTLYKVIIGTSYFMFAIDKVSSLSEDIPIKQLVRQFQVIEDTFKIPVIYITPRLLYRKRFQLISHNIPFIAPNKQLYVPQLGLLFTESFQQKAAPRLKLSTLAQAIVLFRLIQGENLILDSAAVRGYMPYSLTSVCRTFKELEQFNLGTSIQTGKRKVFTFNYSGLTLLNKALPYLSSPVQKTLKVSNKCFDAIRSNPKVYTGGETALAEKTDLAFPEITTLCVYEKDFKDFKLDLVEEEENYFLLDIWQYPVPSTNILPLYLQFRNEPDDRIQIALHELMERYSW